MTELVLRPFAGHRSRGRLENGPNHDEDPREKGWILSDGQDTTGEGAAAIADALAAVGFQVSEPPD